MNKITAIVVTYNPDNSIRENIKSIALQCEEVFIIDNGSSSDIQDLIGRSYDNVTIVKLYENFGIAHAYNIGVTLASADTEWIATFDQDTLIMDEYFSNLINQAGKSIVTEPTILTPNFSGLQENKSYSQAGISEVDTAISSGSLISKEVFNVIGTFDDKLFIDYVDNDFCLRARSVGIKIIRVIGVCLDHKLGNMSPHRFFGLKLHTSNHSALRRYYVFRNRIVVYRKFAKVFPKWFIRDLLRNFTETLKILMWEEDKKNKLVYIFRGIEDGFRERLGKYEA